MSPTCLPQLRSSARGSSRTDSGRLILTSSLTHLRLGRLFVSLWSIMASVGQVSRRCCGSGECGGILGPARHPEFYPLVCLLRRPETSHEPCLRIGAVTVYASGLWLKPPISKPIFPASTR